MVKYIDNESSQSLTELKSLENEYNIKKCLSKDSINHTAFRVDLVRSILYSLFCILVLFICISFHFFVL